VAFDINNYIKVSKTGLYKSPFKKKTKKKKVWEERYWRFLQLRRRFYKNWPYRRDRRQRKRSQFYNTKKQEPLLLLTRLHAPWRQARYKLKANKLRLFNHLKAFQLYYQVRKKPCKRLVRSLKNKKTRLGKFIRQFETRLDVVLYRLGWAPDLKTARRWVLSEWVSVNAVVKKNPAYVLNHNDKISLCRKKVAYVGNLIRNRHRRLFWRVKTRRSTQWTKPRGFDRYRFRTYKKSKRRQAWSKFFLYFANYPQSFTVNYNTLTAIYKPDPKFLPSSSRYPRYFGPKFFF
jgi:ribosomal protein S4